MQVSVNIADKDYNTVELRFFPGREIYKEFYSITFGTDCSILISPETLKALKDTLNKEIK